METVTSEGRRRSRASRGQASASALPNAMLTAALVSTAATMTVVFVPDLRFAYKLKEVHVALETAAALIGLLAAYLVVGRFRRNRHLDDLALWYSLGLLACSNLFFAALPALVTTGTDDFATWARLLGQLLGSVVFSVAALAPPRRVRLRRRQVIAISLSIPAVLSGVAIAVALARSWLPTGVELVPSTEDARRPRLEGHVSVLGAQLAGMALYCVGAVGFARKARATQDELFKLLAVASVFGAFSRLNYFLYPSLYTDWVYFGDVFRLAFYVAILAAAAREIGSYWETLSHTAVLEERRRIARDLHDGLAQELAYIGRNLRNLDGDQRAIARVTASAARALSESRRAIDALTKPLDEPLEITLAEAARETAEREGTSVELELSRGIELDYRRRDALIRIACEAIANAARHGAASRVRVELDGRRRRVRLRVVDDGTGFDPQAAALGSEGFGMTSMRERAHAVGASFELRSGPGRGTTVEVVL